MSSPAFAAVLGPVTGSAAPARGLKAQARPAGDDGAFATALRDSAESGTVAEAVPARAGERREEVADTNETIIADASKDAAEVVSVAVPSVDVPATASGVILLPPAQISALPDAGGVLGAASPPPVAPEGQGDADVFTGAGASQGDGAVPATPNLAADSKVPAEADAALDAGLARAAKADASQGQPLPTSSEAPAAAPREPKVVTPPATDRAREVAAARSAVVTPARPAKAGSPIDAPASPVENSDVPSGEADAPAPGVAAPATVETGRVRDVIDRSVARAATEAPSAEGDTPASPGKSAEATGPSSAPTTTPKPASQSDAAPPTVPATLVAEEPATTQSGAPVASTLESQAVESAQTPALSTLARTTVETTAQIAAQIVRKLEGRSTRFEMALTPEGLGRVDISLDIEADGSLRATLAFDNPIAATDLRGRADELRRQLTDAGFTLADDALSFADRDPSAGQGGGFDRPSDRHNARAFGAASRLSVETDLSAKTPSWIHLSLTPTGVDMKV